MTEKIIQTSKKFWNAMLECDGETMKALADPECMFVHIGTNANLQHETDYYTGGVFQPTNIDIHKQDVKVFSDTAIVLTDVDYGLLLNGTETTHHFMVTEVYQKRENDWRLIQFSFTALVY